MNTNLCHDLFARYPALFSLRDDPRYPIGQRSERYDFDGIDCGAGWFDLLDRTFSAIAAHAEASGKPISIQQVTQKFGKLRLRTGRADPEVRAIIDAAQNESLTICEQCGRPGRLTEGWGLAVACEEHKGPGATDPSPELYAYIKGRR